MGANPPFMVSVKPKNGVRIHVPPVQGCRNAIVSKIGNLIYDTDK
jgi:hypothetical protein